MRVARDEREHLGGVVDEVAAAVEPLAEIAPPPPPRLVDRLDEQLVHQQRHLLVRRRRRLELAVEPRELRRANVAVAVAVGVDAVDRVEAEEQPRPVKSAR